MSVIEISKLKIKKKKFSLVTVCSENPFSLSQNGENERYGKFSMKNTFPK